MKIAFIFNDGRLNRLDDAQKGILPTEFYYGAIELEKLGHKVSFFEINPTRPTGIVGGMLNIMQVRGLLPDRLTGSILKETSTLVSYINSHDCVVATSSGVGFALAILRWCGRLRPQIIAIHCALANSPYSWFRRMLTYKFLQLQHSMLFGDGEFGWMISFFKKLENNVVVNQFGVDTDFWKPACNIERKFILAVGNDGRRDFITLCDAAPAIPFDVKIVTTHTLPEKLSPNILILNGSWKNKFLTDEELRSLYQSAFCVVVPLTDSLQPSGQSVCLQAMACGTPVILTETQGLWSKSMMRDGENVLFVQPGNPVEIAQKIDFLRNSPEEWKKISENGFQTVRFEANITQFAMRLEQCCLKAISSN